ncbi:MAG: DUF1295 domain-containing protein [Nitrospirae bacterium]|nr:DUF1295 domain-containing protein [Nitrospirota bacterium]
MSLQRELKRHGDFLFRHRSYIPVLFLPVLLLALKNSEYIEQYFGDTIEDIWELCCIGISFAGLLVRGITVGYVPEGTSGRNTKQQKASCLNTTGMYSLVRHPLYLGNFLIMLGMTMFTQVWWLMLISILAFWLYYERIMFAEEEFLKEKFGDLFLEWAENTPAFLPRIQGWRKPDLPFSLRTVLKREYTGFFVITSAFTFLEVVGDAIGEHEFEFDDGWKVFFVVGLTVYVTLRTIKKRTRLFHVSGR